MTSKESTGEKKSGRETRGGLIGSLRDRLEARPVGSRDGQPSPEGAHKGVNPAGFNSSLTKDAPTGQMVALIKILKNLLMVKEPTKNYKFVCVRAANKYVDGKILNDYINYMVLEDPNKLKYVVNTLIKEYKLLNIKKYDTTINKGKYNR
jgi:hypothetical protein